MFAIVNHATTAGNQSGSCRIDSGKKGQTAVARSPLIELKAMVFDFNNPFVSFTFSKGRKPLVSETTKLRRENFPSLLLLRRRFVQFPSLPEPSL